MGVLGLVADGHVDYAEDDEGEEANAEGGGASAEEVPVCSNSPGE